MKRPTGVKSPTKQDCPPAGIWRPRSRFAPTLGPFVLAALQVVGTFGASRGQPESRSLDVLAVVIAVAGPLSLLLIRRFSIPVLFWIAAITLVYLLRDYPYGPVFTSLVIAIVVNVVLGHRMVSWAVVGTLVVVHFLLRGLMFGEPWRWGLFAGVVAWALLILVFAEFARMRGERAGAARRARAELRRRQEGEERLRIARELHDVVAHHMSLINVQAGVALHLVDRRPEQAQTALAAIKDASKEALTELRSLVDVLRADGESAPRSPAAMLGSLDDLVLRSSYAGLHVEKRISGAERSLPAAVELAAFRIIQEATTNVVRHSGASSATISLDYGDNDLTVVVDDDGGGTAAGVTVAGNGIRGMQERALALGGRFEAGPGPGGGLRACAILPLGDGQGEGT